VVDVAGVESYVTAGEFRCHVGAVKHSGIAAAAAATAGSGRVPRMSCAMRPWLRAGEETAELVVHVTGSEDVRSSTASAMCLGRQVAQDAVDWRHLTVRYNNNDNDNDNDDDDKDIEIQRIKKKNRTNKNKNNINKLTLGDLKYIIIVLHYLCIFISNKCRELYRKK